MPFPPEALDELARVFVEVAFEALLQEIEQMEEPARSSALACEVCGDGIHELDTTPMANVEQTQSVMENPS
jgi:hypothetical protein